MRTIMVWAVGLLASAAAFCMWIWVIVLEPTSMAPEQIASEIDEVFGPE